MWVLSKSRSPLTDLAEKIGGEDASPLVHLSGSAELWILSPDQYGDKKWQEAGLFLLSLKQAWASMAQKHLDFSTNTVHCEWAVGLLISTPTATSAWSCKALLPWGSSNNCQKHAAYITFTRCACENSHSVYKWFRCPDPAQRKSGCWGPVCGFVWGPNKRRLFQLVSSGAEPASQFHSIQSGLIGVTRQNCRLLSVSREPQAAESCSRSFCGCRLARVTTVATEERHSCSTVL